MPLEAVGLEAIGDVGGKNASLGEMIRELASLGVRVPPGFATTAVDAVGKQGGPPSSPAPAQHHHRFLHKLTTRNADLSKDLGYVLRVGAVSWGWMGGGRRRGD